MLDVKIDDLNKINHDVGTLANDSEEVLYLSKKLLEEIEGDVELKFQPENVAIENDLASVRKSIESVVAILQDVELSSRKLLKELEAE